jgi:hypothetical protein
VLTKSQFNSEKMVVVPSRLYAFWVHFSRYHTARWKAARAVQPQWHFSPTAIGGGGERRLLILHLSKEVKKKLNA